LLDKRESVIDTLETIENSYLQLVLLKQHEKEACEKGDYEYLYELSENERMIIENITGFMKYIVPDLLFLRRDSIVKKKLSEVDRLHATVISDSLKMRDGLEEHIARIKQKIKNLDGSPKSSLKAVPHIVNIRA